jgi:threonine aldolase
MIARLPEDHETARVLAEKLAQMEGISINWNRAKTNMVWLDLNIEGVNGARFVEMLDKEGLKVFDLGPNTIRMLTHFGITLKEIDAASDIIHKVIRACGKKAVAKAN